MKRTPFLPSRISLVIVLALAMAATGGLAFRPPLSLGADIEETVTLIGDPEYPPAIGQSSPAAADLDGDGDKEIVVGGKNGRLFVIARSGSSWSQVWSRQTADDLIAGGAPSSCAITDVSDIRSSPAIADLDGDGHLEIVVSTGGNPSTGPNPSPDPNGGVLVYRYDSSWSFSVLSGWPQPTDGINDYDSDGCWDGIWSTPALGDLDGDGDLEVVVEGFDRRIHAWHHDGTAVDGWPIYRYNEQGTEEGGDCLLRGGWSSPALGDIDGDGLPEVVVGTNSPPWNCPKNWPSIDDYRNATVWAINGDSTNVPGWPVTTQNNVESSPALGDIDGDGELEVVVGSGDTAEGGDGRWVYAWNGDGSTVTGWPQMADGDVEAPPALGDLDGDGALDVVVGCGTEGSPYPAPCRDLYAWHGDGTEIAPFPVVPVSNNMPYTPVLADYDRDGEVEILVLSRWSSQITIVDLDGQVRDSALLAPDPLESPPLVDDVDGDGELEVVLGGGQYVRIWGVVDKGAGDDLPWPMFHRDVERTGMYPRPPKLAFPDEVRILHKYGSGDTEVELGRVRNEREGMFDWSITHAIPELQVLPPAGTVTRSVDVQFVVTTTGYITGWHELGTVTVVGTVDGAAVDGSPAASDVWLYVGDPGRIYVPLVLRNK